MSVLAATNAVVRFTLEICALIALGYWGFRAADTPVDWLLGLGAPLVFAVVWGTFVAPKARRRLQDPGRAAIEALLFSAAVLALAVAGRPELAALFGVAVAMNLALMFALGQRASGRI